MNTTFETDLCDGEFPLGMVLNLISRKYAGALSLALENCGTDRYVSILLLVAKMKKPVNQQFLVDQLHSDKASMVRKLDYLCKKNLLRRTVNPVNRREYLLELTPTGKKKLPLIQKEIKRMNEIALGNLSETAKNNFMKALGKLACNLDVVPAKQVQIRFNISNKLK